MKKGLVLLMFILLSITVNSQQCWKKQFDWETGQLPTIIGLKFLDNRYYIATGGGIICINGSGGNEWNKKFPLVKIHGFDLSNDGNLLISGERIVGDTLVAGLVQTKGIGTLIKLDTDGKVIWERSFLSAPYTLSSIAYVVTSSTGSTVIGLEQSTNNNYTFALIALGVNGAVINQKSLPTYGDGNLVFASAGFFHYNRDRVVYLDSQFDTVWVRDKAYFGISSISKVVGTSPDGGVVMGIKTIKFNAMGAIEWSTADASSDLVQQNGDYILITQLRDTSISPYFFIRAKKLNSIGNEQWHLDLKKSGTSLANGKIVMGSNPNFFFFCDQALNYIVQTDSSGVCLPLPAVTISLEIPVALSINELSAFLNNDGIIFYPPGDRFNGLMYPTSAPVVKNTIFTSALWIGGIDGGGDLHMAAQTYRQAGVDYMPWPIDALPAERHAWDHIWKVTKQEVDGAKQDFADNGQFNNPIPSSILHWPAKFNNQATGANGADMNISFDAAPFHDHNGDGVYNAYDGDYPIVYGDEMYWWMFTDDLPIHHLESEGKALGVEVSAYAYAFNRPQDSVLHRTIFTRYEIVNRSANTYSDVFLGIFSDIELGCFNDDYVGCDTLREFYFGYNGSLPDSCAYNLGPGYGNSPPVQSVIFLNHSLDRFGIGEHFNNFNFPTDRMFYLQLQNKDENENYPINPLTGNQEYHFLPGNPNQSNEWSAVSQNFMPFDAKAIGSTGPYTLLPNGRIDLEVAYVVHPNGKLIAGDNFADVQTEVDEVRQFHGSYHPVAVEEVKNADWDFTIYPNPNSGSFNIDIKGPGNIEVFDLTGKTIEVKIEGTEVSGLPAGTYLVRVESNGQYRHQKVMVF